MRGVTHTKFGPDRFSRFGDYGIQTNEHLPTDRQAKFIYRRSLLSVINKMSTCRKLLYSDTLYLCNLIDIFKYIFCWIKYLKFEMSKVALM